MLPTVWVTHPDSWEDLDSTLDRLYNFLLLIALPGSVVHKLPVNICLFY